MAILDKKLSVDEHDAAHLSELDVQFHHEQADKFAHAAQEYKGKTAEEIFALVTQGWPASVAKVYNSMVKIHTTKSKEEDMISKHQ